MKLSIAVSPDWSTNYRRLQKLKILTCRMMLWCLSAVIRKVPYQKIRILTNGKAYRLQRRIFFLWQEINGEGRVYKPTINNHGDKQYILFATYDKANTIKREILIKSNFKGNWTVVP